MTTGRRARTIARALLIVAGFVVLLAACSNVGPMDALNPEGPTARREHRLFVPVFWIAAAIFLLVEGGIVFAIFRFRERRGANPPVQIHGNTRLEIGWTIAPAVLLGAIAIPTVALIFSLAQTPKGPDVVHIKVTGHQWWWEYEYTDVKPVIATANEMVIPTGRQIALDVTSADVIHSFWVPKLGGKQDAIPGRSNPLTLIADKPGTYYGQCAEFCALSHANMKLRVVAKAPAAFLTWLEGQKQEAADTTSVGATVFAGFQNGTCMQCHTIRGIEGAGGQVGPDLTHFASRSTFAGSILNMNRADLIKWLTDPPKVKPGSLMPNYHIPRNMIDSLVAFLLSLK